MAFSKHDFIDNDLTFTAPNDSDSNVHALCHLLVFYQT